jgi:hypothetical protein
MAMHSKVLNKAAAYRGVGVVAAIRVRGGLSQVDAPGVGECVNDGAPVAQAGTAACCDGFGQLQGQAGQHLGMVWACIQTNSGRGSVMAIPDASLLM